MKFKQGNTASKGRPKGTPNKSTKEVRQAFQLLIESNLDQMQQDLNSLSPRARLEIILKLSQFVLPRLEAVSHTSNDIPENLKFIFDSDEKELKRRYGVQ